MAYQVYAGTMREYHPEDLNDTACAQWVEKKLIWSSDRMAETVVMDPVLTQEKNQIGTFTFTVPKLLIDPTKSSQRRENALYGNLQIDRTMVAVYQDGELYWLGYVTGTTLNFDMSKTVTVRETMECFTRCSAYVAPQNYYVTTHDSYGPPYNLEDALTYHAHMAGVDEDDIPELIPPFRQVDVQYGVQKDLSKEGTSITVAWDAINSYWLDEYDGYFRITYTEKDGKIAPVLRYTNDVSEKTAQTVEYGVNILDLEIEESKPSDLVNCVYSRKYVTTTNGWWIFKSTSTDYIWAIVADKESIKKYGEHTRQIVDDSASTKAELEETCRKTLATYKQDIEPTISVKAFDLCDAGLATDHLGFLKKTHIISKPHGIDEWMVCTKEVLPLDKPDQKEFTFGRPPEKLTKQQNKNTTASQQAKLTLRGLVSHAQG